MEKSNLKLQYTRLPRMQRTHGLKRVGSRDIDKHRLGLQRKGTPSYDNKLVALILN